ncbi:MAG: methylated-DNA--[protein]-cysteine S-methyltransferase, partial [Thermodesulfobacteriota bacterium]
MCSPIGRLYLAGSEKGITDLKINITEEAFRSFLKAKYTRYAVKGNVRFKGPFKALEAYFEGSPAPFDIPLDLRVSPFVERVLAELRKIPYAAVVSYAGIASALGSPAAARAVGNACGANPVPVIIPCHRVVLSSGQIGG